MSRLTICVVILLGFQCHEILSQSGVNISPVPIPLDPSAILNVQSATQGVLLPKTTIGSIIDPTDGLIVYDTILHNYMYFDEDQWTALLKASSFEFYYADRDGDGYGDKFGAMYATTQVMGYVSNSDDCNDLNAAISPATIELCDLIDNNCDGQIDEGFDQDMDGFTSCNGDCDDTNPLINPGALEICNGADENCNGVVDEGFDQDQDMFTICQGDCDDNNASINPNGMEVCNGLDDNCDGVIDEGCIPVDIDFAILQFPPSVFMLPGNTPAIYGRVFSMGVTEGIGQGAGIMAQVGYGANGSDPTAGGWTWVTATFNIDQFNEDEYAGILTIAAAGVYDYAYRFSGNSGVNWSYADLNGTTDEYQVANAGDLVVVDDICNGLDDDGDGNIDENCPDIGAPCDGNDADQCADGVYICLPNGDCGCSDDPFSFTEICNGLDDDCNGLIDDNCPPVTINWGNVQFPDNLAISAGETTPNIYGRVFAIGVTDMPGQGLGIMAQVGYGPDGSDPTAGGWTWTIATFNTDAVNDDEYQGSFSVPAAGLYDYAYRYSGDGGATWLYADAGAGSVDGYSPANAGQLTVN